MKSLLFLVLLCSLSIHAAAQQQVLPQKRNYTVTSYKLLLDWRLPFKNKNPKFRGVNEITLVSAKQISSIELDATEMRIDSVFVNGSVIMPTPQQFDDTLVIPLSQPIAAGATTIVRINYTRITGQNDGMYFYAKGTRGWSGQQDTTAADLAYTMSEPLDAHKWMPCNDEPYNKASSQISIIVPKGISAQSNGTLMSVDTNVADSSHTYNWKSDKPIATYLMVANASQWATWHDYYHRLTNPSDSVACVYYVWPTDTLGTDTLGLDFDAKYAFRNTPKMLATFSRLFGEFPFVSYSQVVVDPFNFGGMEHQTITTLARYVLRPQYRQDDVIAHELMHQWFGDKVTCETWADIWLNEGFATMGEWLWEEAQYGRQAHDNTIEYQAYQFFQPGSNGGSQNINTIPTYNPPIENIFNDATTYLKPGCVLHMLRRAIDDDSLFFGTLRNYNDAFAYSTCNTFQFRDYLEQHLASTLPVDPVEFINEWIFRPDWPKYAIAWNQRADNTLFVKIDQAPDSSDHYTMPLRFFAIAGQDTTRLMFVNDKRSQFFSAHLDRKIDTLIFDRLATIISENTMSRNNALEGVHGELPVEHYLRAMSATSGLKLIFEPAVGGSARIELLDVLGRTLQSDALHTGSTMTMLSTSMLSAGTYFVRLTDSGSQQIARVQLP